MARIIKIKKGRGRKKRNKNILLKNARWIAKGTDERGRPIHHVLLSGNKVAEVTLRKK